MLGYAFHAKDEWYTEEIEQKNGDNRAQASTSSCAQARLGSMRMASLRSRLRAVIDLPFEVETDKQSEV